MTLSKLKLADIILGFLTFLLAAGTAYAVTIFLYPSQTQTPSQTSSPTSSTPAKVNLAGPKTEACPLNGAFYTKTEKNIWSQRRPLFVMIENHVDARPQSGLNEADIVYEAVAEGGITRFGAVYYCGIAAHDTILGPVRSARTYFINWASEYNYPLYVHVGGANCSPADPHHPTTTCKTDKRVQALEQLERYGWGGSQGNDLNQFSIGFPTFWRDYERLGHTVATEHTMYTSTDKLYQYAKTKRGWTNLSPTGKNWLTGFKPWSFKDDAKPDQRGKVAKISFEFWRGYKDFDTVWQYNPQTNSYLRFQGGKPHKDRDTDKQISAKVVIIQFIKEEGPVDSLHHMFYHNLGQGQALVFQDGQVVKAHWSKSDRQSRTIFTTNQGQEIKFNRGKIFIEGVPAGNQVNY